VPVAELPRLIERVYATLSEIEGAPAAEPKSELKPAVAVRKSVTEDHIVCLEDGKKFKSLKRHLRTRYDMSPEEYREKWSLPADYPMVAPNYARQRSDLARKMGLGLMKK
jgi:predicted transcriptional regulator